MIGWTSRNVATDPRAANTSDTIGYLGLHHLSSTTSCTLEKWLQCMPVRERSQSGYQNTHHASEGEKCDATNEGQDVLTVNALI
jgi:hypothetical protein